MTSCEVAVDVDALPPVTISAKKAFVAIKGGILILSTSSRRFSNGAKLRRKLAVDLMLDRKTFVELHVSWCRHVRHPNLYALDKIEEGAILKSAQCGRIKTCCEMMRTVSSPTSISYDVQKSETSM